MTAEEIGAWLVAEIARVTESDPAGIDVHAPFDALGLSSSDGVILSGDLETLVGRDLSPTLVYEHPSIAALAAYLAADPRADSAPADPDAAGAGRAIAIVGIACRLPGASDPAAFWRLLDEGIDAVGEVPADRWDPDAFYDPDPAVPGRTVSRWGGFLERIDRFDPFFFGISPGEAERMDPQQRLLLELAFEAFEDAGCPMPRLAGSRTAVLVGISVNEYGALHFRSHRRITGHSGTGASLSIAANRISYTFDLHGPSVAVDTACSSSLAAVHLACRSLASGECDLALAGGVNLILSPAHAIAFTKAGVLAPDGRCKPFDARANGYVRGEGGGFLVLKPLDRALAEGDRIYAVIRGSAMAQDGRTNGLMAPNARAQEMVLRDAYRDAAVPPHLVRYVEAHGTGTLLGDAMEASALGAVISEGRDGAPCALGSVKSNLGHLEAAAGVAGLIKLALALRHRRLPPSLHFEAPNPHVPFDSLRLAVQSEPGSWPAGPGPLLGGVSSFGFGGTNVHLVVEEAPAVAPPRPPAPGDGQPLLIPLSAHTEAALVEVARRLRGFVSADSDDGGALEDLAFTTARRRTHLDHRLAVVARSRPELLERLDAFLEGTAHPDVLAAGNRPGRIAFVFSGQGGQWPGMARDLLAREPGFRAAVEECDRVMRPHLGWSVLDRLAAGEVGSGDDIDVLQPVLFVIQVALAALWRARGVVPDAVVGHSMGEVAAAHVAGALTLEDAARVIVLRSRLLRRLSGTGGMVLVGLPAEETVPLLARGGRRLSVAASNGPRSTVVAGAHEELGELIGTLERAGVFCRAVNVDVPAHGPDALPLAVELRESLADLDPAPPSIEFVTTVAVAEGAVPRLDAEYWAGNLTEPVRFAAAVSRLLDAGCDTFVEIGPHPVLQSSIQQSLVQRGIEGTVVPALLRDEAGVATTLRGLGTLYASGRSLEWEVVAPDRGCVLSLPTYPWQRERFWLETSIDGHEPVADRSEAVHPLLGRPIPLAAEPRTRLWQTGPAELADAFLLDHRLDDRAVLPAAAYLEMVLAAAAEAGMAAGHELVELSLPQLLELSGNGQPTLQTRLAPDGDATAAFTVHARRPGSDEWMLHASARLRPSDGELHPPVSLPPAALRARCPEPVAPDALYRMLASRGLQYGPRMRAVVEAWRGRGEALGRIVLPEAIRHGAGRFHLHPVLLDAALQTVAAAVGPAEAANGDAFVPASCRSVRLDRTPVNELWSHVILRQDGSDRGDSGEIRADVRLVDDRGGCIAELADVRFVRKRRHRPEPVRERDTWFYRVGWQPAGSSKPTASNGSDARDWVVIGHPGPLAGGLRSRLEAAGHRCRVLAEAPCEILRAGATPLRGIVYLGESVSEAADAESPAVATAQGTAAALRLVQAVAECGAALGTPRLWLVTRGAQQVLSDHPVTLDDAALWGLGKSVALELPELRCTLLDLDPAIGGSDAAERLAAELLQADAEDQVALRGGARLVARLLPDPGPLAAPACATGADAAALRPEATYLITGGLGGLGLTVAAWMVERGAEHLVLAGRSGASPAAEAEMARLAAAGARVEVARVDVTRPDQVAEMLRRIRTSMPPLEGVIHAAGVLENAAVVNLDPDRLARVLAPKVAGAWHLHEATRDDPLRFFVLFSSAVSVLGSPGQGNYAAANAFLDALGRYRRARGLPASSINWGPWAEVGLVADSGLKGIRPARGCEVLDWVLRTEPAQVAVLPFDLATLLELYPAAARIPLFAEVGGRETHVSRLYARPQLRQAYIAPRNEVERRLAELWRQTLRIDRVGVRDSFFELGGDSVLAAQIIASTHRTFGVEIDVRDAFRSFTIESLAERVEAALVARLDELTDAEVDRLLQE